MVVAVVIAVVLAVVALGLGSALVVARQATGAERRRSARLDAARVEAEQRAVAAESARAEAESARVAAQERATAAESARAEAEQRAAELTSTLEATAARQGELEAALADAERRVVDAERRATEALAASPPADAGPPVRAPSPPPAGASDPDGLWALERHRAERTWRTSVALDPHDTSPFAEAEDDLATAARIDVAAVNEEVGARLDVDWALPPLGSPAAKVLVRRVVEELVAGAARGAEQGTVRVAADGADVIVEVDAVDAHGRPELPTLDLASERVVVEAPGRVRLPGLAAT